MHVPPHVADRQRLAAALQNRRGELRLSQPELARRAEVSLSTVNLMERAKRDGYRLVSKRRVEDVVGWAPGSIDALLSGGDATVIESEREPEEPEAIRAVEAPSDLAAILDRLPEPTRRLWERLACRIADELANTTGLTISDEVVTVPTDFGTAHYITSDGTEPPSPQVEAAAQQLQTALALLTGQTRRSVR